MRLKLIIKGAIILTFTSLLVFCKNDDKSANAKSEFAQDSVEKFYPVKIQKVTKQAIEKTLDYSADLVAFKEIHYAPASPGRINRINVEIGNRVSKGQVLVQMDKTQFIQAKTQYENTKLNFQRIDTLRQLGSISEQQYDQTKTQYELAESNYQFLRDNTTLLSPINGIVTGKYFENGELYSGAPNTAAGKAAIISLMQINPLKAIVSISQSYFPQVHEKMEAEITTDIFAGTIFKGSVYKVYPTIDPSTRTFKAEILIKNDAEKLRPGMYANIEIKLGEADAMVVPSIAVLKQEGTNNRYVFVNENGIAKQIEVKIGKRFDDKVELIAEGLKEGAELIVEGQANLLNGSRIKIAND